jgi:amino acid transporter
MALDRQLPQVFARVSKKGVPYYAVIASFAFGPLAYLSESVRVVVSLVDEAIFVLPLLIIPLEPIDPFILSYSIML